MIKENVSVMGEYFFFSGGKLIGRQKNTLIYLQMIKMLNILLGYTPVDMTIKYCALGTGTTAASINDSTLETEGARVYRVGLRRDYNVVTSDFTFTELEAIGTWTEVGLFCGTNATSASDTGLMWSRAIITPSIIKASGSELTVRHVTTWSY